MDWLAELRALPPERVLALHEPRTPRYTRAEALLPYLVEDAELIGVQPDPERTNTWLLVTWCAQRSRPRRGFYSCFRVFLDDEDDEVIVAILYCFYDGLDDSPRVDTRAAAEAMATTHGFGAP